MKEIFITKGMKKGRLALKRYITKFHHMGFEESKWRPTPLLWIFICFTGGLLFFINVFQTHYSYDVVQPTIIFESVQSSEDVDTRGFLLKTKGCRIPEMEPLDPSVRTFIFQVKPVVCNGGTPPLVESNRTSLYLLSASFPAYNINDTDLLTCCYSAFWRVDPRGSEADNKVEYDEDCVHFNEDVNVSEEFVMVKCFYNSTEIYRDYFCFVPLKAAIPDSNEVKEKLNVLVYGVDSISRLNFHRQMPKTLAVLRKLKAVELLGYNKVGDNTFPNLIPILTGYSEDELKTKCWPNTTAYFDDCPFIWSKFNDSGYATAFGEDASWMGIFNYQKRGFKRQPTAYYWKSFNYEAEKKIGNKHELNMHQCVGGRESYKLLLEYADKLMRTMRHHRKHYFGFFWSSSLSHDFLNMPQLGDETFSNAIRRWKIEGLLENTVFIFLSDHGIRWGAIRSTFQGRIEERLPFVHVYLPEWYRDVYPLAYSNLLRNSRRLTTPFDLHTTLLDLINPYSLTRDFLHARQANKTKRRDYSFFDSISPERTCADAAISSHWCTCEESVKIDTSNPAVGEAANFTVDFINRLLVGYSDCATLELDEVINSQLQTHNEAIRKEHNGWDYTLTLRTKPGDALFEATVRRKRVKNNKYDYEMIGTISRINLYGKQSLCITDFHLKLYCFCK